MDATQPMTRAQRAATLGKLIQLKKTKHATFFLEPVDVVALDIPTYPDIVEHPMDLSTMETKLRNKRYHCVQDFVADFELIVANCRKFNSDSHPITVAARNMKVVFYGLLEMKAPSDKPQQKPTPTKQASPTVEVKRSPKLEAGQQKFDALNAKLDAAQRDLRDVQAELRGAGDYLCDVLAELEGSKAGEVRLKRENGLLRAQLDKARAVLGEQGDAAGTS